MCAGARIRTAGPLLDKVLSPPFGRAVAVDNVSDGIDFTEVLSEGYESVLIVGLPR